MTKRYEVKIVFLRSNPHIAYRLFLAVHCEWCGSTWSKRREQHGCLACCSKISYLESLLDNPEFMGWLMQCRKDFETIPIFADWLGDHDHLELEELFRKFHLEQKPHEE